MIARSSGAGLLLVFLTGCVQDLVWRYDCDNPDPKHLGPDGKPDPCHDQDVDGGTDGGADSGADSGGHAEPKCVVGEYVHWQLPWEAPTLLWVGPEDQAPECPWGSTSISYEGRPDLVALPICEACTCEPPTGSCALPSTLTASTAVCGTPGVTTSFNAPAPWNGSCDSTTQTPSGAAHSLTIAPLTMTENGCASGPPTAAKVISLRWETFARGCDIPMPPGPLQRSTCWPEEPIPPGFKACIFYDGESACPNDDPGNSFTEQHVLYKGVQDDRQCSACSCGAPTGSTCKAQVSIYEGASCSTSPLLSIPITSVMSACFDITLPGQALGSKSAGPTTYLPGTCPPGGGDGSGTAIPIKPSTFCCRP